MPSKCWSEPNNPSSPRNLENCGTGCKTCCKRRRANSSRQLVTASRQRPRLGRRRTQDLQSAQSSSRPRFHAQLVEELEHMFFHGGLAVAHDRRDLSIGFALAKPEKRFPDARRQVQNLF